MYRTMYNVDARFQFGGGEGIRRMRPRAQGLADVDATTMITGEALVL